ncbi:hypothetical protein SEA_UPYO_24 [Gordonia phage Upyo]|nr:hypothetical protein SEA_UPYO_24 [Gordonia phage Upyo]
MTSPDGAPANDGREDVGDWGTDGGPLSILGLLGKALIMAPLDKLLSGFLGAPAGSFDTVEELVQDLIPAVRKKLFRDLAAAIGNVPIIGDAVEAGLAGWFNTTRETAEYAQGTADYAQTVAVYTTFNVSSVKPLWMTMDPTAEVSFPWVGLSVAPGGTTPSITLTASIARLAKFRVGADQVMNTIAFLASRSGTVTDFRVSLFRYRPSDAAWLPVFTSVNLQGNLVAGLTKQQIVFSADGYPFTATDQFAVQFHMVGTGTVSLAAKTFPDEFIPGFEPEVIAASRNPSTTPVPSIITNAEMDSYADGNCPYVEIGSNIGQVDLPRSWYINFDNGSWNNFVLQTSGSADPFVIRNGRVSIGDSNNDGWRAALYGNQVATDKMEAQFNLHVDGRNRPGGVGICCDYTGWNGAFLVSENGDLGIATATAIGNFTVRKTAANAGGNGSYKIRYDPEENIYRGLKLEGGLWVEKIWWEDTTDLIGHGSGQKFGTLLGVRSVFLNSPDIDEVYFRDW